jgi:rhamnosyltransferase subunit B
VTGFIFYDKAVAGPPDRELGKFLEQGDPPVVFTLGTSASTVAGDFYRASVEAARRGKWRAIFVTGADPRNRIPAESLPASMFVTDYAAYSELFPRAAAVVHPGGIGTVAQALRAGVPMIIVPHAADQPDNAFRAARLGVARVIPRGKYDASRAWKELGTLLENPRYSSRSKTLAAKVRAEDGLARACDILERHAAG